MMTRRYVLPLLTALSLGQAPTVSLGQPLAVSAPAGGPSKDPVAPSNDIISSEAAGLRALIGGFDVARATTDAAYAESVLQAIERAEHVLAGDPELGFAALGIKSTALLSLGRTNEAEALAGKLIPYGGGKATVGYAVMFSVQLHDNKPIEAIETLEAAVADASIDQHRAMLAASIHPLHAGAIKTMLADDADAGRGRYRLAEALLGLGWEGGGDADRLDDYRLDALDGRMRAGDLGGSRTLVSTLQTPRAWIGVLASKLYDPLFEPGLDREAKLMEIIAREDARTAAALAADPGNLQALLERVRHLRRIDRDAEALSLAEPIVHDMAAVEKAGLPAFWLVEEAVEAMYELGREDEAFALLRRLVALNHEEHPALINMTINQSVKLRGAGRYGEAVDHALRVESELGDYANSYGHMILWNTLVCSLSAQGKSIEAERWVVKMQANMEASLGAMTDALVCIGDTTMAEQLMVKRLSGREAMATLISVQDYQDEDEPSPSPFREIVDQRWSEILDRPSVKAAIEKVGRRLNVPLVSSR